MAADEPGRSVRCRYDACLRRSDVRDRRLLGRRCEHRCHLGRQLGDRRRHDRQVGFADGVDERLRRLDGGALGGDRERGFIGIPADDVVTTASCGERDGRSDQARADDGDSHTRTLRAAGRVASC
jgi:hypothetical protein